MENILHVNIVKLKPSEFGLFCLEGCCISISQIKLKLLSTFKAQKVYLIQIRQKHYSSFSPIILSF